MISPSVMVPWLLTLALKASLILAAAFVVTALLRGASAATRHLVWLAAFVGLLALPLASAALPSLSVPVPAPLAGVLSPRAEPEAHAAPQHSHAGFAMAVTTSGKLAFVPYVEAEGPRPVTGVVVVGPRAKPLAYAVTDEAAAPATVAGASPSVWPVRVFLMWLFGFVMVAVAFAVGVLRTHLVACSAMPAIGDDLADEVEVLSADMGIVRDVKVVTWNGPAMPMTWGALHPVVLLPDAARNWPAARRREVLMHELAHVRRGDWVARLIAALACAIHWFNPLVWMAASRLRNEQELACDDAVLAGGVLPSDYATHLLEVARGLRVPSFAMANASVAMARPSQLTGRLLAVLDESRARVLEVPGRTVGLAWLGAILMVATLGAAAPAERVPAAAAPVRVDEVVVVPGATVQHEVVAAPVAALVAHFDALAPVPVAAPVAVQGRCEDTLRRRPSGDSHGAVSTSNNGGRGRGAGSVSASGGRAGSGQGRGSRSSSWSDASDEPGSVRRATLMISDGDCRIEIRMTGIVTFSDDESDVASVSQDGSIRVTEEGDGTERRFDASWRDGRLQRRWRVDGGEVAESAELRAWLGSAMRATFARTGYNAVPRAMRAYRAGGLDSALHLAEATGSDYMRRMILQALIDSANVPASEAARIARQALTMSSDYERAELLITVARKIQLNGAVQDAMVEATRTMSSDYERRRVLSAALARRELSARATQDLLRSAVEMSSDYEKAELLIEFSRGRELNETSQAAFLEATSSMSSDYERRRVLAIVMARPDVPPGVAEQVCAQTRQMSSDYERAELLVQVARKSGGNAGVRTCIRRATEGMGSDYERDRVLAVLGRMSQ